MLDKSSSTGDICPRAHAISLLLANDPALLRLLFDPLDSSLRASASELCEWVCGYSAGQRLLVQIALDFWSGEGNARLWDIIGILDSVRFEGFMLALEALRFGKKPF